MEEVQQHIIENSRRYLLPPHPRLIRAELEYIALGYVIAVLSQDKIIRELHRLINVYGSIFVVGAGISFETGIPLTIELEHILHFCGAKTYSELRVDENKCRIFKKVFKDVCDKKVVGVSHKLISKYFGQKILHIICLNWDNLIERAAKHVNKVIPKVNKETNPLNEDAYLWKFDGDIESID